MSAPPHQLDELSQLLAKRGVAAFCATTLSVPFPDLRASVQKLGAWITQRQNHPTSGALPLGIHLEGPYIDPAACGAHPPEAIRPLQFKELDQLWEDSQHTLKLLTFAPERRTPAQLTQLIGWAKQRKITLSLGHSRATEEQATQAFDAGVQGMTHGWNALSFHHRAPGAMGGRPRPQGRHSGADSGPSPCLPDCDVLDSSASFSPLLRFRLRARSRHSTWDQGGDQRGGGGGGRRAPAIAPATLGGVRVKTWANLSIPFKMWTVREEDGRCRPCPISSASSTRTPCR